MYVLALDVMTIYAVCASDYAEKCKIIPEITVNQNMVHIHKFCTWRSLHMYL